MNTAALSMPPYSDHADNLTKGVLELPLLPAQRKLLRVMDTRAQTGIEKIAWIAPVRQGKGVGTALAVIRAAMKAARAGATAETNQYIVAGLTNSSFINNNGNYLYAAAKFFGLGLAYRQSAGGLGPHFRLAYRRQLIARLFIFGGDKANSWERIRGISARGAWLDEATLIDKECYNLCLTRYDYPNPFTILTSNHGSPTHWVKADVIDVGGDRALSMTSRMNENIYRPPELLESLLDEDQTSVWFRRYIAGEWAPDAGLIIPIPDTEPPLTQEPYEPEGIVVIDPATARRTAALLFVKRQGYWLVADEYIHDADRHGQLTPDERLDAIIHGKGWRPTRLIVDPEDATFRLAARKRRLWVQEANNHWDAGIQTTNNTLTAGLLRINRSCTTLLVEASAWRWNERERQPEPGKHDALDCLRYGAIDCYPTGYAIVAIGR